MTHLSAVAAPIFNPMAECIAAVAASGLSMRFEGEHLEKIKEHVRKAAEEISTKLGGGHAAPGDAAATGNKNRRTAGMKIST